MTNGLKIRELVLVRDREALRGIPEGKVLINTINAYSFVTAQQDEAFATALRRGDYLIPDGISIVKACNWLAPSARRARTSAPNQPAVTTTSQPANTNQPALTTTGQSANTNQPSNTTAGQTPAPPRERIAGADLFAIEMKKLNAKGGKCFFMGSSEEVLAKIREKAAGTYPNIEVITYSPPYKPEFSPEDNKAIIDAINAADPDLLWIGMTAPKQEKWAFAHWDELDIHCHCGTIGAVFDFFAGTVERAPARWQKAGLEWLYRLLKEPRRMWRRYLIGNTKFMSLVLKEKLSK